MVIKIKFKESDKNKIISFGLHFFRVTLSLGLQLHSEKIQLLVNLVILCLFIIYILYPQFS